MLTKGPPDLSPKSKIWSHVVRVPWCGKRVKIKKANKNPTDKLNMPKDRVKGMNPLTKEQSNRLLEEAFNSGCFEFYYLELTTGLRLGEILVLEWDDLDINKRTLTINKQVQRINSVLQTETPKTKNSIRTIAISSDCASALARLKM